MELVVVFFYLGCVGERKEVLLESFVRGVET